MTCLDDGTTETIVISHRDNVNPPVRAQKMVHLSHESEGLMVRLLPRAANPGLKHSLSRNSSNININNDRGDMDLGLVAYA